MVNERVPVAVVGTGYYGSRHVAKYRSLPSARLAAVVDDAAAQPVEETPVETQPAAEEPAKAE